MAGCRPAVEPDGNRSNLTFENRRLPRILGQQIEVGLTQVRGSRTKNSRYRSKSVARIAAKLARSCPGRVHSRQIGPLAAPEECPVSRPKADYRKTTLKKRDQFRRTLVRSALRSRSGSDVRRGRRVARLPSASAAPRRWSSRSNRGGDRRGSSRFRNCLGRSPPPGPS